MLTSTQIKTAQSILNIFETGEVHGEYGNVTVIEGDPLGWHHAPCNLVTLEILQ